MVQSKVVIEEIGNPAEVARLQAQDERHRHNSEWLAAHWPDLLPQARNRFVAVAEQNAFIADTPEQAWQWVDAVHPQDDGAIVRYVRCEEGPRIYADFR